MRTLLKNLVIGTFALNLLGILVIAPGFADTPVKHKASSIKHVSATKWPQICPVSGETIPTLKDAVGSAVYKGKTYYFCCSMCKPLFVKDPAKYVAAASKGKYLMQM